MQDSLLQIETLTSQPVSANDAQLRLRSQVVQLRLPGAHGGLIWNRPVAVVARMPDGQEQILPIRDVTRIAILALAAMSLASTLVLLFFRRKTT